MPTRRLPILLDATPPWAPLREASARFVISEPLGREYCRRYGEREFQVVTDGVEQLTPLRVAAGSNALRIYFMGLFHMGYSVTLARSSAVSPSSSEKILPQPSASRCVASMFQAQVLAGAQRVTVLPFADEAQVQRRHAAGRPALYADPVRSRACEAFARYSLSTKMITCMPAVACQFCIMARPRPRALQPFEQTPRRCLDHDPGSRGNCARVRRL